MLLQECYGIADTTHTTNAAAGVMIMMSLDLNFMYLSAEMDVPRFPNSEYRRIVDGSSKEW